VVAQDVIARVEAEATQECLAEERTWALAGPSVAIVGG
jgi:hypothetical protein